MDVKALLDRALSMVGSAEDLARVIDATLLSPNAAASDAERLVVEASERGYACVVLTPLHVVEVSKIAERESVRICSVVGFPTGSTPLEAKLAEAKKVLEAGAQEIDLVPALWKDTGYVSMEVERIVEQAKGYGARVKVILEAQLWPDSRLEELVAASSRGGAFMVKTSTGVYTKGGDPYTVYRLSRAAERFGLGVKASGGIRTAIDALLALGAGASRIGTSSAARVLETFSL